MILTESQCCILLESKEIGNKISYDLNKYTIFLITDSKDNPDKWKTQIQLSFKNGLILKDGEKIKADRNFQKQ